jgi:hypothetical protein
MFGEARGAALSVGIEHEHLDESLSPVPPEIRESLLADLR